jgi:DNA-binding NarL/FixJ family response regulator
MSTAITLLIVDGHPGVREALLRRLQHVPGVGAVAAVGSISAGVRPAQEFASDAVIYDPRTVAGDAAEAVRRLAAGGCPVVVLTSSLLEAEAAVLARGRCSPAPEGEQYRRACQPHRDGGQSAEWP